MDFFTYKSFNIYRSIKYMTQFTLEILTISPSTVNISICCGDAPPWAKTFSSTCTAVVWSINKAHHLNNPVRKTFGTRSRFNHRLYTTLLGYERVRDHHIGARNNNISDLDNTFLPKTLDFRFINTHTYKRWRSHICIRGCSWTPWVFKIYTIILENFTLHPMVI
jgi:hypothetical protein